MAKPTGLPIWATVGGDIVEPPLAKKQVGWRGGERPPAQYENWYKRLVHDWIEWFVAERIVTIHAASFQAQAGSGGMTATGSGGFLQMSAAGTAYAPVILPSGVAGLDAHRVISIVVYYDRGGLGTVTPSFARRTLATNANDGLVTGAADAASSGIQAVTLSLPGGFVLESDRAYYIAVTSTAATLRVHGAVVTYDIPV